MTLGWPTWAGMAVGALVIGVAVAAIVQGARFEDHLETLERTVARTIVARSQRHDLPPEVVALADRLGAKPNGGTVVLHQRGEMWSGPKARPMAFVARQTASPRTLQYVWNADMTPGRLVKAADYYVGNIAGLEVKILGLLTIVQNVGGATMQQGEALRYLAEIPWNPDAILLNHDLKWTVVDPKTLRVAKDGAIVTFVLDDAGLPRSMSAPSRVYMGKGLVRALPWSGRFSHYERMSGRLIPTHGEVSWTLDGKEFVYWRGVVTSWSAATDAR